MSYTIYHDVFIQAEAAKIFDAIVQPNHLINWWPLRASGFPESGHRYNYHFSDEYDWYGEVKKVVKNQLFIIKMTETDEDWNGTELHFELEQQDNGVNLKFAHAHWKTVNHHYRRTSFCWGILLLGLKDYVEKGSIIPFPERS